MVSLKFRRGDESDRTGEQRDREDERRHDEPDERTRLLPREPPAYLSPDDPAVSINRIETPPFT